MHLVSEARLRGEGGREDIFLLHKKEEEEDWDGREKQQVVLLFLPNLPLFFFNIYPKG